MREFACKSLGNDCGWRYRARTDDLLTDIVAVHLRDVHGIPALNQDMIGNIKHAFSAKKDLEGDYREEDLTMKEFRCKDMGLKCDFRYIAQTPELIVDGVAVHSREAHGIAEFSSEMAAKVKQLSHVWKG